MKKALVLSLIGITTALSSTVFAQVAGENTRGTPTRASVKAELVDLQHAGYNPASDQTQYPANIQAAENRKNANGIAVGGYGPSTNGTSARSLPHDTIPGFNYSPDFQRP